MSLPPRSSRAYSFPSTSSSSTAAEEPLTSKTHHHSTVTCIYQANIAGNWRNVTVLWSRNLMHHYLCITVDSVGGDFHYSCKIDVKPWHFWGKKGYKSFEVEGNHVEVYWDLRSAKFSGSPEPGSGYYIALVSDEEVVLLLGDYKKKAYKRAKSRPALVESLLFCKKENVFARNRFSTRARFEDGRKENEIVVESSTSGPKDPEMWISIDGTIMIHIRNLQWKFRGNQTVMVNKQPLQVYWDVHDWLFSNSGSGSSSAYGLFVFKPGPAESESEKEGSPNSDDSSGYYSTLSTTNHVTYDFCLGLYAWKID